MRLILYPIIITIALLVVFAEIATPIVQHSTPEHTLPVHKTLYVGRDVGQEEMLHIMEASIEWNRVTNGQVAFDIKKMPQPHVVMADAIVVNNISPDFPEIILLDTVKHNSTLGFFNEDWGMGRIALVDERIKEEDYTAVILHELGHSLGLQHPDSEDQPLEGVGSLMFSSVDLGSNHITSDDLKQFCKLYHCDSSKFHGVSKIQ